MWLKQLSIYGATKMIGTFLSVAVLFISSVKLLPDEYYEFSTGISLFLLISGILTSGFNAAVLRYPSDALNLVKGRVVSICYFLFLLL